MNVDDVHFVARKQKTQFKLKSHVSPFISNTKYSIEDVVFFLKQMNFEFSFSCSYNSLGIKSSTRVALKSTPYSRVPKLEIK